MKKNPARKPVDSQWLKTTFQFLNGQFFNNRIPGSLQISFEKNCGYRDHKKKWISTDAYFDRSTDSIAVDEGLNMYPDFVIISLLHEMVHADLRFQGYVGYPADGGHGTRFHGEITRLINAGAYDGVH